MFPYNIYMNMIPSYVYDALLYFEYDIYMNMIPHLLVGASSMRLIPIPQPSLCRLSVGLGPTKRMSPGCKGIFNIVILLSYMYIYPASMGCLSHAITQRVWSSNI